MEAHLFVQRVRGMLAAVETAPLGDDKLRIVRDLYELMKTKEGRRLIRRNKEFAWTAHSKALELMQKLYKEKEQYSSFLYIDAMVAMTSAVTFIEKIHADKTSP
jgi:hypothetical protein